jgi:hypothetical protein
LDYYNPDLKHLNKAEAVWYFVRASPAQNTKQPLFLKKYLDLNRFTFQCDEILISLINGMDNYRQN